MDLLSLMAGLNRLHPGLIFHSMHILHGDNGAGFKRYSPAQDMLNQARLLALKKWPQGSPGQLTPLALSACSESCTC